MTAWEPRFGDAVRITDGFYTGATGRIFSEYPAKEYAVRFMVALPGCEPRAEVLVLAIAHLEHIADWELVEVFVPGGRRP